MKKIFVSIEITTISEKEIWMRLMNDVHEYGFQAEFCEFFLEHPDLSIAEIDREFRDEWDI